MTNPNPTSAQPGWYPEPTTGLVRWWDGSQWGAVQQQQASPTVVVAAAPVVRNGFAIAALVLGIWGFLTTGIPLFIGLFLGAVPDILAIVFGILGIIRAGKIGGRGLPMAVIGLVLGSVAFIAIFFGAGTIW